MHNLQSYAGSRYSHIVPEGRDVGLCAVQQWGRWVANENAVLLNRERLDN